MQVIEREPREPPDAQHNADGILADLRVVDPPIPDWAALDEEPEADERPINEDLINQNFDALRDPVYEHYFNVDPNPPDLTEADVLAKITEYKADYVDHRLAVMREDLIDMHPN